MQKLISVVTPFMLRTLRHRTSTKELTFFLFFFFFLRYSIVHLYWDRFYRPTREFRGKFIKGRVILFSRGKIMTGERKRPNR